VKNCTHKVKIVQAYKLTKTHSHTHTQHRTVNCMCVKVLRLSLKIVRSSWIDSPRPSSELSSLLRRVIPLVTEVPPQSNVHCVCSPGQQPQKHTKRRWEASPIFHTGTQMSEWWRPEQRLWANGQHWAQGSQTVHNSVWWRSLELAVQPNYFKGIQRQCRQRTDIHHTVFQSINRQSLR
jgi:hypothetical protein